MKQSIAIIGASYLQLPLVEKAKQMGLYTICFAWEEGAVCRSICDKFYPISITEKEEILLKCKVENIKGIISIASDVAVPTVNFIAEKLALNGNSIHSGFISTNKYAMREALKKGGLKVPKFIKGDGVTPQEIRTKFTFPIVIKPVDRSGSRGITIIDHYSKNIILEALAYSKEESLSGHIIVEEFIKGNEISVEAISFKGDHQILAFTDKVTTGSPHFVEVEHHQPSHYWNSEQHESIIFTIIKALKTLNIFNGASHSELIITEKQEVYVTEVGSRMGGDFIGSDLVKLSTNYDFLKATIRVALDMPPHPVKVESGCSGIHFITSDRIFIKELIQKYPKNIIRSEIFDNNTTQIKNSSDRSGYILYQSDQRITV